MIFEHDIRKTLDAQVTVNGSTPRPMDVQFRYSPEDPYALWMVFPTQTWCFARDLLLDALDGVPSGKGDVHIHSEDDKLCVHISSPDGRAQIRFPRSEVTAFAAGSTALVLRGAETDYLDLDAVLAKIFASSASADWTPQR